MDYQEYFDSLTNEDLNKKKSELIEILHKEYQNESVLNYGGLNELIFEFILSLEENSDFESIILLEDLLSKKYKDVHDAEYGNFAEILIQYYIKYGDDEIAKKIFTEWSKKEYDYDLILITINNLIHYGKVDWIDEFIEKEYLKIRESPKLIEGAEYELNMYKVMIEIEKFNRGKLTLKGLKSDLLKYDLILNREINELLSSPINIEYTNHYFKQNKDKYIIYLTYDFQKHLFRKNQFPYLSSYQALDLLIQYLNTSKYNDQTTYFKIQERPFIEFMNNNSVNGLTRNVTCNFAILLILPSLYEFLLEIKVFEKNDVNRELAKTKKILRNYEQKHPKEAEIFKNLEIYRFN